MGEAENVRKKNSRSDTFQPDPEQGFQKNGKKIQKTKKYHCGSFSRETGRDRVRMREKKNGSYQFLANPEYRIPKKIAKKFIKLKTSI